MDAGSTYVGPGFAGRTRLRQPVVSNGNLAHPRPDIREAEVRIIKDIKKIRNALTPGNIANHLIAAIREELVRRIETMNTQRFNEVGDKMITSAVETVKDHPGITALVGLGVSWLLADNMLKQKTTNGKIAQSQEQAEEYIESNLPHLKESVKESKETIARKSQTVMEGIAGYMDENPLLVGFIGLSAGLILGILTSGVLEGRNELLDETRRTIKTKTGQILHETKEKAGHVIDAARQAAREEAERQHLIPH